MVNSDPQSHDDLVRLIIHEGPIHPEIKASEEVAVIELIEVLITVRGSQDETVLIEVGMITDLHVLLLQEDIVEVMIIVVEGIEVEIVSIGEVDRDHHTVAAIDILVAVRRHVGAQRRKPICCYRSVNPETCRKYNFFYWMNLTGKTISRCHLMFTLSCLLN